MTTAYLAGRYTRREELRGYAAELEALGIRVVARWLDGSHQWATPALMAETEAAFGPAGAGDVAGAEPPAEAFRFALDDLEDVRGADLVVSFTERPRDPVAGASRGGRHVEFGIAYERGAFCMVVGWRENVFHLLPGVVFCRTWADALAILRTLPNDRAEVIPAEAPAPVALGSMGPISLDEAASALSAFVAGAPAREG